MSTVVFTSENAGIAYYGRVPIFNSTYRLFQADGSECVFLATGTDLTATFFSFAGGSSAVSIAVDGGAPTTPTLNSGSNTTVTVFSGLTDTEHSVVIKNTIGQDLYADRAGFLSLTGASPALALPGSANGYGAYAIFLDIPFAAFGDVGSWLTTNETNAGYTSPFALKDANSSVTGVFNDCQMRFNASATSIKLWTYQVGTQYAISKDSGSVTIVTTPNTNTWEFATLLTGLDGQQHQWEITNVDHSSIGQYVDAVMCVGGAFGGSAPAARLGYAFYGDSITNGTGVPNSSQAWVFEVSHAKNVNPHNRGIAGTQVAGGDPQSGAVRYADVTSISPAPTICFILYGTNDVGAYSVGTFATAYASMLTNLKAGGPSTRFICLGLLPRTDESVATQAPYIAAIQTAATNAGLEFYDTTNWIDINTDLSDVVHPNAAGYAKIAAKVEGILSPARILHASLSRRGIYSQVL